MENSDAFGLVDLRRLLSVLDDRTRGPGVIDLEFERKKRAAEPTAKLQRRPQVTGHNRWLSDGRDRPGSKR